MPPDAFRPPNIRRRTCPIRPHPYNPADAAHRRLTSTCRPSTCRPSRPPATPQRAPSPPPGASPTPPRTGSVGSGSGTFCRPAAPPWH
eukprot:4936793-Prymnesium_polylepis.1